MKPKIVVPEANCYRFIGNTAPDFTESISSLGCTGDVSGDDETIRS
jgi:hypothetical protein